MRNRLGNKITACFLTVILAISVLPVTALAAGTAQVATYEQLLAAAENTSCGAIQIKNDIVVEKEINLTRSVLIDGGGFTVRVPETGLLSSGVLNINASKFQVFIAETAGTNITISNINLQGGAAKGGALTVGKGVTVSLSRVAITNSGGGDGNNAGGGLYNSGTVFMRDCIVNRNAGNYGGGFLNDSGGFMVVENSSFNENRSLSSSGGGGAAENQGTLYINNCTFSNNKSTELGGAINDYGGMAFIMNSTFTGNVAYASGKKGGALRGSASVVVNCLFAYNYEMSGSVYYNSEYADYNSHYQINSVFHGDDLTADNEYNRSNYSYTGADDGSDDSLFAGGVSTKVLDATGVQTGENFVYQPYLYTVSGEFTSVVPLNASSDFRIAFENGVQTAFDPYGAEPLFAYKNADNTWCSIKQSGVWNDIVFEELSTAPVPTKIVTTDQYGNSRGSVIGSTSSTEFNLYMVKLIHDPETSHGEIHGVTVYGDVYKSGDSVTVIATPDKSYYLEKWLNNATSAELSVDNPYVFSVNSDLNLKPQYTDVQPPQLSIPTTLVCSVDPASVDLNSPSADGHDITVSAVLKDSGGTPLSGKEVTFYILDSSEHVIYHQTVETDTYGGVSFTPWTPNVSGEYKVLTVFTGSAPYSACRAEKALPIYYKSYNINYVFNNGTPNGETTAPCDTPIYITAPTRTGYSFTGWTVSNSGINAKYGLVSPTVLSMTEIRLM